LDFVNDVSPTDELLKKLYVMAEDTNEKFVRGAAELLSVVQGIRSLGVPDAAFKPDLRIARGLEYYTGTVYETQLIAHPDLGSICSGGRYDDLAGFFTTEKLPGVGISIGFSRLLFALLERGVLATAASTPAQVLVTVMDVARMNDYLSMARELRAAGISTELFLEKGKLGDQLRYASRKGFKVGVLAGETEFAAQQVKLKDLAAGNEVVAARTELVATAQKLVGA
jgi:histidyl-tRNA synthetase